MKLVLLVLSGDPASAKEWLRKRYPRAEIVFLSRAEIESSDYRRRLKALRSLRPDVFAVATERLAWQRGQTALLAFGAMAGARRVLLLDAHGDIREETRARILSRAPIR